VNWLPKKTAGWHALRYSEGRAEATTTSPPCQLPGCGAAPAPQSVARQVGAGQPGPHRDGHLATVHGFLELGRTLHLDGMVVLRRILISARHLRDLLADASPLGGIPPNGIHSRRSTVTTGPYLAEEVIPTLAIQLTEEFGRLGSIKRG